MSRASIASAISLALLLALVSGCTPRKEPPPPPLTVVPITDPQRLEELWSRYIFDGITTICNVEFDDPARIKHIPWLVDFALRRLVKDEVVKPVASESRALVYTETPTADQVSAKIKEYFDCAPAFDLQAVLRDGLGQEGNRVRVYVEYFRHDAPNPWRITLGEVTCDTAAREYRVALKTLDRTTHIVLKERDDKTLYYQSVRYEYPVTNYVQLTGPYVTLKAEDFGGFHAPNLYPVSVRGTAFGDKVLLWADRPLDPDDLYSASVITLSVYDPDLNTVEARCEVPQQAGSWFHGLRVLEDKVVVKLTDSFCVVDGQLVPIDGGKVPLPEPVKQALSGNGFRGAYDVSADLKWIAYTDRDGLHLHDLDSGQTRRLSGHIQVGDRLLPQAYILAPHFSAKDEAVIAMLSGYEGYYGIFALSMAQPGKPFVYTNPELYYGIEWTNARYPYADLKLSWSSVPPKLALMDLEALASSGPASARREVILASPSEQQPIGFMEYLPLFNDRYFVYVALAMDPDGAEEKHVYRIVRVDLETMQAETLLTIDAGTPYLRALTADGRVMFSYNFKRELGFAITGK